MKAAFDGVFEVTGFDRFAVRVFEAGAQEQRVGLAAVGDFREFFGEAGDDFRAFRFRRRFVGQQRDVDRTHRGPTLGRVRDLRIHVVREGGVGAFQRAAFVAFAFSGSRLPPLGSSSEVVDDALELAAAPTAASGQHDRHDRCEHSDRKKDRELLQSSTSELGIGMPPGSNSSTTASLSSSGNPPDPVSGLPRPPRSSGTAKATIARTPRPATRKVARGVAIAAIKPPIANPRPGIAAPIDSRTAMTRACIPDSVNS